MKPPLESFFGDRIDISDWTLTSPRAPFNREGVEVPMLTQEVFQKTLEGSVLSVGIFYLDDAPVFAAWGFADEKDCGMHAPIDANLRCLDKRIGCPDIRPLQDTSRGFILDEIDTFTV